MTEAYYNEFDAYPAQWLRNLSERDIIARGKVDERSIKDVRPEDLTGHVQCHFFAGIGGWSRALRLAGIPDDYPLWTGSCPCQPFSVAGKGRGFADERHLWPVWFNLIRQCLPPIIFGEQVGGAAGLTWLDAVFSDLEGIGYACGAANLPAASVGAPHIRQRLFFVADRRRQGLEVECLEQTRGELEAVERGGAIVDLGDAECDGRGSGRQRRSYGWAQVESNRPSASGGMAYGESGGQRINRISPRSAGYLDERGESNSSTERVAYDDETGCPGVGGGISRGVQTSKSPNKERPQPTMGDQPGILGTTTYASSRPNVDRDLAYPDGRKQGDGELQRGRGHLQRAEDETIGFWRDVIWLPCSDGKARPVKPGLECLVNGVSGRLADGSTVEGSRTGMLRGFGNAIVPIVAAEFIKAALDLP